MFFACFVWFLPNKVEIINQMSSSVLLLQKSHWKNVVQNIYETLLLNFNISKLAYWHQYHWYLLISSNLVVLTGYEDLATQGI